jgi:predicted Zn-dependent protease
MMCARGSAPDDAVDPRAHIIGYPWRSRAPVAVARTGPGQWIRTVIDNRIVVHQVQAEIAAASGPFQNWEEAIRSYRSLVVQDPENPLLNMRLADALLRYGNAEASLVYFARVVKSKPLTADAHVGYATALASLNRLKDARRVLEDALLVDPSGQVHYNLGEIARAEGRIRDARREFEAARADPVTTSRALARLSELR